MKQTIFSIVLLALTTTVWAGGIGGKWKTIDDESGKPKSIIRIEEHGGTYSGVVESLLPGIEDKCIGCKGDQKDRPITNMTVLKNLKNSADNEYEGGTIFDPKSGKTYKCKAELIDGGKKLNVRGYIGFSLIGRTQTWLRVE